MFDRRLISNFDWVLCGIVLLMCSLGILAIYSATSGSEEMEYYRHRQLSWLLLGVLGAFLTTLISYKTLVQWGYVLHIGVITLLILVLSFGTGGPGSPVERWLQIGPFFVQPSEFVKFSLILALANYFQDSRRVGNIGLLELIWPSVLVAVPCILIIKQPDLGTALLLIIISVPIIFLVGLHLRTLLLIGGLAMISLPMGWIFVLKPYQKDRILTFLNPDRDPLGSGYHVIQSIIAVGSGGVWGKGFGEGTQGQLNFLPAHHTDFIFAVFAEEWGFVGAILILILFMLLALWSLSNILKIRDRVSCVLTVGVVMIITSQAMVNIGMVLGTMPVVGVPLPFFSYGGSSMLSLMFGIGLLLNIRMRRFQLS